MTNFLTKSTILVFLLTFVGFVGCKSTTEPGTSSTTVTKPGVGSSYTYRSTSKDSTGTTTDDHNYVMTVSAVNQSIGGKSGVTVMTTDTSSSYLVFQSNGDVLLFAPLDLMSGSMSDLWITLPFSGGAGSSMTVMDTTYEIFAGVTMQLKMTFATSYVGTESITAAGKTFNAKKVKQTMTTTSTVGGVPNTSSSVQYMWFAPEIGGMIKSETVASRNPFDGSMGESSVDILTAYSVK